MTLRIPLLAAAATVLLCFHSPAHATDDKYVSATECEPYAPDTTAAELQVTPAGVYNPGTTSEKIICPLPRDQDVAYLIDDLNIVVYYRVLGGTPARLTCSLYVGSTTMQTNAIYTTTASGELVSAGARGYVQMSAGQTQFSAVPGNVICTLPPKTSMGGIFMQEYVSTAQP
jgi:hypothetical protein